MFRIRLWITLWLSVGFAGLISSEMNLKCHYFQYGDHYACQVFGENILDENQEISFSGDHLSGKSDDSVTMLAFYQTTMYYMPTNLFSKFSKIQNFQCDSCWVKKIEKSNFKQAGNLKTLKLLYESIETLPNDLFYFCDKLESIGLQANDINKIEEKAFSGLRNLKEIYLNHNLIENLKKGTLDDLLSLEILDLESNKIEKVVANLFEFNTNLKKIYLSRNRIAVIDPNLIAHLEKLTLLDFRFNDCGNRVDFYDNRPAKIKSTFNQNAPQCTEENRCEYKLQENGKALEYMKHDNYRCGSKVSQLTRKNQVLTIEKETFFRNITILKNQIETEKLEKSNKISELEETLKESTQTNQAQNAEIEKLLQKIEDLEKSENVKQTHTIMQKIKKVIAENLDIFLIDFVSLNFLALFLIVWTFFIIWKHKSFLEALKRLEYGKY
jgi:Leucine-rich repeat (LRR) protein